jgi:N-acetylmuramoyl-L-alanine amidase
MKTIALCIGHSRIIKGRRDGGAVMVDGTNEWSYNLGLADGILAVLRNHRIQGVVIDRYEGNGYGAAQRWLAAHLKTLAVDGAVELHFNSSDNASATGHEWLYWHSSTRSRSLASNIDAEMALAVPELRTRGIKSKTAADRGAEFLSGTHCPAVIAEPFFGSNPRDCEIAIRKKESIARAIAEGILSWLD